MISRGTLVLWIASLAVTMLGTSCADKSSQVTSASVGSAAPSTPASSGVSASASQAPLDTTAPKRLDLSNRGLPLALMVPGCVKIREPLMKNATNLKDLILACDPGLSGNPPFALQIGLSEGKVWKSDVRANKNFKRFTTDEPNFVRWQAEDGKLLVEEFIWRQKVGGTSYACFPQFAAGPEQRALLEEELAACRSIAAP